MRHQTAVSRDARRQRSVEMRGILAHRQWVWHTCFQPYVVAFLGILRAGRLRLVVRL